MVILNKFILKVILQYYVNLLCVLYHLVFGNYFIFFVIDLKVALDIQIWFSDVVFMGPCFEYATGKIY